MSYEIMRIPHQYIDRHWAAAKVAIRESVHDALVQTDEGMNMILRRLLSGHMQLWLACTYEEEKKRVYGIIVTSIIVDDCSRERCLLIYAAYSLRRAKADISIYLAAINEFKLFAKQHRCKVITAYTQNDNLVKVATKRLGANAFTMLSFRLEDDNG